ncbi:hypothetical protein GPL21_38260 [Bradyrhizobium pachyrhizi]|uniref:Uncharacterized protein n=2 Tax=Bradyrhizobium pachyrhizi TaxID=280333 RepID=A0A844T724_9BRAD|nr:MULTISPECIES: hypothetical protein [Bradyrhizobium]MVT70901.1 hypothetical protein [Bradyrhizobium pachyrhizi]WOH78377.1 hypothetical protein RX327_20715 [Bradyrhizobium sp. BEA-2-5]
MIDPLFARAQLAIEESHTLRAQKKSLADQRDDQLAELRQSVRNSASARMEIKAHRDNST